MDNVPNTEPIVNNDTTEVLDESVPLQPTVSIAENNGVELLQDVDNTNNKPDISERAPFQTSVSSSHNINSTGVAFTEPPRDTPHVNMQDVGERVPFQTGANQPINTVNNTKATNVQNNDYVKPSEKTNTPIVVLILIVIAIGVIIVVKPFDKKETYNSDEIVDNSNNGNNVDNGNVPANNTDDLPTILYLTGEGSKVSLDTFSAELISLNDKEAEINIGVEDKLKKTTFKLNDEPISIPNTKYKVSAKVEEEGIVSLYIYTIK